MDEKSYQAAFSNLTERISQLEKQVSELRQIVLLQKPYLTSPFDKPMIVPINSEAPDSVVAGPVCWEVTCLGRFHLRCTGHDLTLCNSRRGRSILKYLLACAGYSAFTETLIECFWPNADPEAGAHSLQVAVHALRCSLRGCGPDGSDETVLFANSRYFLNPSISILQDVDRFRVSYERGQHAATVGQLSEAKRAFEDARALYTGDYHADCYEEWASSQRLALIDMRIALLGHLGSLYSEGKEWELAISCYREILAVDCYREDIYRHLMSCYAACGRKADVKRIYHTCLECLRRDLRLTPASETTLLYQQLIQQPAMPDAN